MEKILTATWRDLSHNNPNIKGNERIMNITRDESGNVRVVISGPPACVNAPFVVVSDATFTPENWATFEQSIRDGLKTLNATVQEGR